MNRRGILPVVGFITLSACATQPNVVVVAEGDNTVPFDATGTITVSTESDTIQAANLKTTLRDSLTQKGFRLSDGVKTDYTLMVDPVRRNYSYTAHEVVSTQTTVNTRMGSEAFVIDGTSYSSVPYTATATYEGFVAELYDWKLDHTHPLLIWHGVIAADAGQISKQQPDALSLLVSNLGKTVKKTVRLEHTATDAPPVVVQDSVWTPDSSYFFGTQSETILEMVGTTSKGDKFDGYIRTRPVNTNRFRGYVQTDGDSKFIGSLSDDQIGGSWDIGLGAYVIREDGIYTTHVPVSLGKDGLQISLRDLNNDGLQKIVSFPIEVGARHEVSVVDNVRMSFEIRAKTTVATPFRTFEDCLQVRKGLGKADQPETWEFDTVWVCRGVGIVKILNSLGREDVLINIQTVR